MTAVETAEATETKDATGRSNSILPERGWRDWRALFAAALAAIALLGSAALHRSAWHRLNAVEQNLIGAGAEPQLAAWQIQEAVTQLDAAVFRFQLSGQDAAREGLQRASHSLTRLIAQAHPRASSPIEKQAIAALDASAAAYLSEIEPSLREGRKALRRDTAETLAAALAEKIAPLRAASNAYLTLVENSAREHRTQTGRLLASLQGTFWASALSLGALLASVLWLLHRSILLPLHGRLDESQLAIQRQEKLASLGVLATGVAHEIRNPLTAIKLRLFSLKKQFGPGLATQEDFQTIGREIDRLEKIVKSFLQFARPQEPEMAPVAASELLEETRRLLAPEFAKRGVRLDVDAPETVELQADKAQLQQVLINLAQNAAENMPGGGAVTLRARVGVARLSRQSEPVALLEVSDTGAGIPAEVQKRLFDPFFSTKEGGTGLGLAIAARIVEKHAGRIQFSTGRNSGTTFTLLIPQHVQRSGAHPPH